MVEKNLYYFLTLPFKMAEKKINFGWPFNTKLTVKEIFLFGAAFAVDRFL